MTRTALVAIEIAATLRASPGGFLIALGGQGVHNLRGGLSAWFNAERPIVDGSGPTDKVRPSSETWGRLLRRSGAAAPFPAS